MIRNRPSLFHPPRPPLPDTNHSPIRSAPTSNFAPLKKWKTFEACAAPNEPTRTPNSGNRPITLAYLGFILVVVTLWLGQALALPSLGLLAIPAAMFWVLVWRVLNEVAKPHSGYSLDERQLQVRNQAFFRAYQVVAGLTALGLIYV